MRHRIHGKQLCRDSEHRTAMLRNLAAGLFEHGQIETTLPKAKAVQPFVEKIITIAKRQGFNSRRRIEQMINDRKIHAWVADPNVPDSRKTNEHFDLPSEGDIEFNRYGEVRKAPRLVQHIMTVIGPKFVERDGGYTRIIKIGKHRLGDGTDLVILQLVGEEEGPQIGGGDSRRRTQKQRRRDFAAKVLVSTKTTETKVETSETETPDPEASETENTEVDSTSTEAESTPEVEATTETADDAIVDEATVEESAEEREEVVEVDEALSEAQGEDATEATEEADPEADTKEE